MGAFHGWRTCPRCSSPLRGSERRKSCDVCGSIYYAHSAPAVSALLTDGQGRVLLGRRASEPDAGLWDILGGFVEEGEKPEEAMRRELREETGLEVEPETFLGTYVDTYGVGADAGYVLNLVWAVRVVSGEITPADDVSEVHWFRPDELPSDDEIAFRWLAPFLREWASRPAAGS